MFTVTPKNIKFKKNYVKSEGNACVAASLAMITQQTLEKVIQDLLPNWQESGQFYGIDYEVAEQYLAANGIASQPIDHDYPPQEQLISNWPLEPWAPVHMVYVFDEGSHCVVMWSDGEISDPNDVTIKNISQYHRVYSIVGLWPAIKPNINL